MIWQLLVCSGSIATNSKIDAQKVLQKQDETFIHRSFYA